MRSIPRVAVEEHPAGAQTQHQQTADGEPRRVRREHEAPAGRAVQALVRDCRPEHSLGAELDRGDDAELEDDRPEPRAGRELLPALGQVGPEARRLHAQARGEVHRADERRCEEEGRRVDRDPGRGAGGRDDEAGERAADDHRRVPAQPQRGVRLLQERLGNGLRDDGGGGREEERARPTANRCEDRDLPDLRRAREQQGGDDRLARARDAGSSRPSRGSWGADRPRSRRRAGRRSSAGFRPPARSPGRPSSRSGRGSRRRARRSRTRFRGRSSSGRGREGGTRAPPAGRA